MPIWRHDLNIIATKSTLNHTLLSSVKEHKGKEHKGKELFHLGDNGGLVINDKMFGTGLIIGLCLRHLITQHKSCDFIVQS